MTQFPANHPIWKTINVAVLLTVSGLVLWLNASNFDETELKAIAAIVGSMTGWNVLQSKLESKGSP